jgi:hypothetical protein
LIALKAWQKFFCHRLNQITQSALKTNFCHAYPGVELELKKFDSNFFDAKAQYAIKINIRKLTDKLSMNFGVCFINQNVENIIIKKTLGKAQY